MSANRRASGRRRRPGSWWGLLLLLAGVACRLVDAGPAPTRAPTTVATAPPVMVVPSPSPVATDWEQLRPGLERRRLDGAAPGAPPAPIVAYRLDPAFFNFDVAYRPGAPRTLAEWQAATGALLVVNGGFYTPEFEATGLVIADGQRFGTSYGAFAGMLAVGAAGPELRWLAERPYDPAEPMTAALQSFPLLVKPGGAVGFTDPTGPPARRTVVARDVEGRILFIIAPQNSFTLAALSGFLVEADLGIDIALNLDGGPSSGLVLAEPAEAILAFAPLPTVIVAYPR